MQIRVFTGLDDTGKVFLAITDNGIGIDLNMHGAKIFGLYQRFHSNTNGEGLGLFIVKSQITSLGGSIKVESELGKGTTFTIMFSEEPAHSTAF
jgi:signal transduction histidine kinase